MLNRISLFILLQFSIIKSARILAYFPTPSISHQVVLRPITQELARRGHDVTVITPDPAFPKGQTPENLTEIDVNESYKLMREVFVTNTSGYKHENFSKLIATIETLVLIFEKQIKFEEVQNIFKDKSKKFDLLILEACVKSTLILSHIYKAPVILISSLGPINGNMENMLGPVHPLLYPGAFSDRTYNYTIWEKITEVWDHWRYQRMIESMEDIENEMLRRTFGPDVPDIKDLRRNIDMFFVNLHAIWDNNRPVPPSVVYIGGIHQIAEKKLPDDLQSYLDSSQNGVIYVSFGSNVEPSMFPPKVFDTILNVLSKLPYDVLFKVDLESLPRNADNIGIGKWFPQADVLRHRKIKLFITQGGLQSIDESITAGVPFIGIPMLSDQWYNTDQFVKHKIGIKLSMETLDEEKLTKAIHTVIDDDSYRQNIAHLRTLVYDQPQKPLHRAIWWIEHILLRGGGKHLQASGAHLSWVEYLELPLILGVVTCISLILGLLCCAVVRILKLLFVAGVKLKVL